MKKWYKSKTVGIAIVQILTSIAGLFRGDVTTDGLIVSIVMAVILVINRIYGTTTSIEK